MSFLQRKSMFICVFIIKSVCSHDLQKLSDQCIPEVSRGMTPPFFASIPKRELYFLTQLKCIGTRYVTAIIIDVTCSTTNTCCTGCLWSQKIPASELIFLYKKRASHLKWINIVWLAAVRLCSICLLAVENLKNIKGAWQRATYLSAL